jgi:molecular chaperone DnaK
MEALMFAQLEPHQIDEVILVGGQTRTPKVQEFVKQIFSREPNNSKNPDEVVAVGAAIQGGVLHGEVKDLVLLDVTPLSLGIETKGGIFTKLIERNSNIPTRRTQVFTTVVDNQNKVEINVLQGERKIAAENRSLGKFELVGIPPAPRGVPQIEVTFDIDSNGLVNVSAKDMATGLAQEMKIHPASGLSEDEIQKIIAEAAVHEKADEQRREIVELSNRLEGLLMTNEKTFAEFGKLLEEKDREEVRGALDRGRKAIELGELHALKESMAELQVAARILTEVILSGAEKGEDEDD